MRRQVVAVGARFVRAGIVAMAVAALVLAAALPAAAHGGDEEGTAGDFVRQAIALVVNTPDDTEMIMDKVEDALASDETEGVDKAKVTQAREALDAGDLRRTRDLLEASIGARPDLRGTDLKPILEVAEGASSVALATGEETGTNVASDPMPGRGPLTGGDWVLLVLSGLFLLAGGWLALRFRPADSVRSLRRQLAPPTRPSDEVPS